MNDALYSASYRGFTAVRKALARKLRSEGDREGAKAIETTPKPTLSAWALNQVARLQGEVITDYLRALDAQAVAQLDGADAKRMREASVNERAAQRIVLQRAIETAESDGQRISRAASDKIEQALRNAAFDPEGRKLLARGELLTDFERADFAGLLRLAQDQDLAILKRARPIGATDTAPRPTLADEPPTPAQTVAVNANQANAARGRTQLKQVARADKERADKERADKERADKERADKERADKERADKERADKERADKERADKERADKERAERQAAERARIAARQAADDALAKAKRARSAAQEAYEAAASGLREAEAHYETCKQAVADLVADQDRQ